MGGFIAILDEGFDDGLVFNDKPSTVRDIRAEGLVRGEDLMLFKYSSNYQTCRGGLSDLSIATGLDFGDTEHTI